MIRNTFAISWCYASFANNREMALQRLQHLKGRFRRYRSYHDKYSKFIKNQIDKGHNKKLITEDMGENCDAKLTKIPKRDFYFCTCEDGAGWHLIPYIISPRSKFFSQAYKNWHIMWGTDLGPDWPPLARGSKFHTIHTPTRPLNFLPQIMEEYGPTGFSRNDIIL